MTTTRPRITTTKTEQWGVRKWPSENKIEHNSLNLQARSAKFCMQVDHLDRLQPFGESKKNKLSITQSILQKIQKIITKTTWSLDFAIALVCFFNSRCSVKYSVYYPYSGKLLARNRMKPPISHWLRGWEKLRSPPPPCLDFFPSLSVFYDGFPYIESHPCEKMKNTKHDFQC